MSHERLQAELLEVKKEIEHLKESASESTTETVNKHLSLISVIPKWSGSDDTATLEEFLESIEASARIGRWTENDQREVAVLKFTDSAKLFYQCCDELQEQGATWQKHLSKPLGDGTGMSIRTSTTLRNCRRLHRLEMRVRNNLPIVARV